MEGRSLHPHRPKRPHHRQPRRIFMSRIPTPATIEAAPAAAQPLLQAVKKQLGIAPNLFRLVANSPRSPGRLREPLRCTRQGGTPPPARPPTPPRRADRARRRRDQWMRLLSLGAYVFGAPGGQARRRGDHRKPSRRIERLEGRCGGEVRSTRHGGSRPHHERKTLQRSRQPVTRMHRVVEIVQHVALNTWTNYINTVGETDIDFPVVKAGKVA